MTSLDPVVDPATIPELATILRSGLLSKVRVFEAWCTQGDRLAQVVRVAGRPLALSRTVTQKVSTNLGRSELNSTKWEHRGGVLAMWLDLDWNRYYLPYNPPKLGESVVLQPIGFPSQCQHERASIPGFWLCQQVQEGVTKRVIDDAARWEMGIRRRGE